MRINETSGIGRPYACLTGKLNTISRTPCMVLQCVDQADKCELFVTLAGRPVSCKPLDSFFTSSDWTRHDCTYTVLKMYQVKKSVLCRGTV